MIKVGIRNIHYTILLPIVPLFFGLVLSFLLTAFLPGDPVLAYLPQIFTQEEYEAARHLLGYDQPLLMQFFKYLYQILSGNLGVTTEIETGQLIIATLTTRIPATIEYTIVPIVLGLIAGIILGILSVRVRYRLIKLLIQILIILGISIPIYALGMSAQYIFAYQLQLLPAVNDPFLPSSILFIFTLLLTTRQVRSNYLKKSEEKHILSNSMQIIFNYSVLITSIFLLEETFNIHGFFDLFIMAIYRTDYGLVRVCIFILFVFPAIILLLSNIVYTIYNYFLEERRSKIITKYCGRTEEMVEEGTRYDFNTDQKFKDFTLYRLKSPLTLIGLAIVVFTAIVAIFPQILTPLTIQQVTDIYAGSWDSPSATHPLGQTNFGRDVLGLLAYGVSTSIKVCILPVLIGIAIGLLFGYLSKVHRWVKGLVLGLMVIFFTVPSIIVILIFLNIIGRDISITISIMAMYMVPWVTLLISKGNYSVKLTTKKVIAYFPLFMAFSILLFEAIGFLGFSDLSLVQLGTNIDIARSHIIIAPWATFWPSLALSVLVIAFFMLHYGLKEPIPIVRRT